MKKGIMLLLLHIFLGIVFFTISVNADDLEKSQKFLELMETKELYTFDGVNDRNCTFNGITYVVPHRYLEMDKKATDHILYDMDYLGDNLYIKPFDFNGLEILDAELLFKTLDEMFNNIEIGKDPIPQMNNTVAISYNTSIIDDWITTCCEGIYKKDESTALVDVVSMIKTDTLNGLVIWYFHPLTNKYSHIKEVKQIINSIKDLKSESETNIRFENNIETESESEEPSSEKSEESKNIIPPGTYRGGVDIKTGYYLFHNPDQESSSTLRIYQNQEDYDNSKVDTVQQFIWEDDEFYLNINDEIIFTISDSLELEEIDKPNWAP